MQAENAFSMAICVLMVYKRRKGGEGVQVRINSYLEFRSLLAGDLTVL